MQSKETIQKKDNEQYFLEGPHSRFSELRFTLNVLKEFVRGFRAFHFLGPCATIFGSARYTEGHEYYEKARQMGGALADLGFTIMTGGGPGLMEAANRGAKEHGGKSVGCNIKLPKEQKPNKYLDKWVIIEYFFVRKVLLSKYSYAFIVMPGGYGTLDEFFEAITLIQTKKSKMFPIVLIGKHFHERLMEHINHMVTEGTISSLDKQLFLVTDDIEEAKVHIKKYAVDAHQLKTNIGIKPAWLLVEKK